VLPMALRLLVLKSDGSMLVHADSGGWKPQNCSEQVLDRVG
jgi:RecB family endonuclease NucS